MGTRKGNTQRGQVRGREKKMEIEEDREVRPEGRKERGEMNEQMGGSWRRRRESEGLKTGCWIKGIKRKQEEKRKRLET